MNNLLCVAGLRSTLMEILQEQLMKGRARKRWLGEPHAIGCAENGVHKKQLQSQLVVINIASKTQEGKHALDTDRREAQHT